jgi:hypothetical protein
MMRRSSGRRSARAATTALVRRPPAADCAAQLPCCSALAPARPHRSSPAEPPPPPTNAPPRRTTHIKTPPHTHTTPPHRAGTKEMQARNYAQRKESERKRRELFDDALAKFKAGDIQSSLVDFENVVAMEPRNYVGDSGARVTPILQVRGARCGRATGAAALPAAAAAAHPATPLAHHPPSPPAPRPRPHPRRWPSTTWPAATACSTRWTRASSRSSPRCARALRTTTRSAATRTWRRCGSRPSSRTCSTR